MLREVHALLSDDGWLVVSVVLPWLQSDAAVAQGSKQRRERVSEL